MAGFDPDVFGAAAQPAGFDPDVFKLPDSKPAAPAMASAAPSAAVAAGRDINSIPRQIGLTARYALEGPANMAQIVTEPLRYVTDRLTGQTGKTMPLGELVSRGADWLGLPKPEGADERVVADATRLGFGAGGMAKASQLAAKAVPAAAEYVAPQASRLMQWGADALNAGRNVPPGLAANLPQQFASAAGAGLAGGASREAGGSPLMQGAAALAGGVAAGMVPGAASYGFNAGKNLVNSVRPGQQQIVQQRIDQTINVTLQNQGIDPATITPAMRSALREQVGKAMDMGDLNPEAVARLADYTRLNLAPTRARLTLDPYDVTQEQNAASLAAATGQRGARLPQIANQNNQRLVGMVDDMGGARPMDSYGQGSAVTRAIQSRDDSLNQQVRSAYQAYRDSTGRELPVPLGPLKEGYQSTLKDFGDDLIPGAVRKKFKGILNPPRPHSHGAPAAAPPPPQTIVDSSGKVLLDLTPKPAQKTLSIDDAEMLIKTINLNYTPANVAQARALDRLRDGVQRSIIGATETGEGMESATLANLARDTARQRFQWRDSSPVIQRALGGANADTFVQNNVISKAAGFDDVARAAQVINDNPAARESVRTAIMQKLRESAVGKGAVQAQDGSTVTGNFSGRGFESALKDIGDRKLGLFFAPEEVETLKAMARTASFETFQPRGSAVNNSKTAAGVGSLLQGLSKYVKPIANRLPAGEMLVSNPLDYTTAMALQRPALNIPQGLLMQQQRQPIGQGLLLPAIAGGGLLSAP
jgi:hypothetical protein